MRRLIIALVLLAASIVPVSAQSDPPPEFEAYLRSQLDPRTFEPNIHPFAVVMIDDGIEIHPMFGVEAVAQIDELVNLVLDFDLYEFAIVGYFDDGLYVTVLYTYRSVTQMQGAADAGVFNVTEVFQHGDNDEGWLLLYSLTAKIE
jgi:hypothetical protein